MGVLRKLWCGQYSLGVAFWGFYIVGFVVVLLLTGITFHVANQYRLGAMALAIGLVLSWAYCIIATVGVWNSAALRIKSAIWMERMPGYLARLVVLIYVGRVIWGLLNGGALNLMNLITQ